MTCPECGTELETKTSSVSNYFLIFTTKTFYTDYDLCPNCGYQTEGRYGGVRGLFLSDYPENRSETDEPDHDDETDK